MAKNEVKVTLVADDRSKAGFASFKNSLSKMRGDVSQLTGLFARLLPAAGIGGLALLAKNGIDTADALAKLSDRTGVSVENLSGLKFVASQADTSMESLGKGINRLSIFMAENSEEARKLGITASDPLEAFAQLADALKNTASVQDRASIANRVLGKSYTDLLPAIKQGGDALREQIANGREVAGVTEEQARQAEIFNDNLDLMKAHVQGLSINIGTKFLPELNEITKAMKEASKESGILFTALVGFGGLVNNTIVAVAPKPLADFLGAIPSEAAEAEQKIQQAVDEVEDLSEKADLLRKKLADTEASPFASFKPNRAGITDQVREALTASLAQVEKDKVLAKEALERLTNPPAVEKKPQLETGELTGEDLDAEQAAKAAFALQSARAAQAARIEQDSIARSISDNQQAFDDKLQSAEDFYKNLNTLQQQQADSEIALLQAQRSAAEQGAVTDAEKLRAAATVARINTDIALIERRVVDQRAANSRAQVQLGAAAVKNAEALIAAIEQEARLMGLTNDERDRTLALLDLEKLKISLTADEYKKLGIALDTALDSKQAAEARKQALDDARQQAEDVRQALTDNLQRSIAEVLNNALTGDGGRGAIQIFVDLIRTSLTNVLASTLTNAVLSALPKEAVSGLGGFLGLGGKKDGSNPANALYVQDVNAGPAGGTGGEGGVGSLFGGLFDGIKNMFAKFSSTLSGLFSSIGKGLSGLFSAGGGLGGGLGGLTSLLGFAEGGYTGGGGKYQPAGVVHGGEYVFSREAVQRYGVSALDNLHRIARGGMIPRGPRLGYADGGLVNLPSAAAPKVDNNFKFINVLDPSLVAGFLSTNAGERAILNIIERNPGAVRAAGA